MGAASGGLIDPRDGRIVDAADEKRYQAQLAVDHELFCHLPVGIYRITPGPEALAAANPAGT